MYTQTLPVTLLLVFLLPWDCAWFSSPYASPPLNMVALPDVQCLAMPHMIHMAVSMISALLSVAISALFTLGDVETSPLELHPMATAHTRYARVLRVYTQPEVIIPDHTCHMGIA